MGWARQVRQSHCGVGRGGEAEWFNDSTFKERAVASAGQSGHRPLPAAPPALPLSPPHPKPKESLMVCSNKLDMFIN